MSQTGITEHLLRWGWYLPEGYDPVKLADCPWCRELVLFVTGNSHTIRLNRDGRLHRLHPRTRSIRADVSTDDVLDVPVNVLRYG